MGLLGVVQSQDRREGRDVDFGLGVQAEAEDGRGVIEGRHDNRHQLDVSLPELIVDLRQDVRRVLPFLLVRVPFCETNLVPLYLSTILAREDNREVILEPIGIIVHSLIGLDKALQTLLVELQSEADVESWIQSLEEDVVAETVAALELRETPIVVYIQVNALEELADSEVPVVVAARSRQTQWIVVGFDGVVFEGADDVEKLDDGVDEEDAVEDDSHDTAHGRGVGLALLVEEEVIVLAEGDVAAEPLPPLELSFIHI